MQLLLTKLIQSLKILHIATCVHWHLSSAINTLTCVIAMTNFKAGLKNLTKHWSHGCENKLSAIKGMKKKHLLSLKFFYDCF